MILFMKILLIIIALIILGVIIYLNYGFESLKIMIQIISAVFIVIIFQLIGYSIYDKQYLKEILNSDSPKTVTNIIDGVYDFQSFGETSFNTSNKYALNYIPLNPSINQSGGAEYSYNFWLYKSNLTNVLSSEYKVLFFRGSKQSIYFNKRYNGNCLIKNNITSPYVLIKNPLVRISKDGKRLIVEYNTITNPDALNSDGTLNCNSIDDNATDDNMLGIYDFDQSYDNKFSMITIVLKETSSDSDILNQNNTNCKLYLNGTLILDRNTNSPYSGNGLNSGSTVMKNNKGSLYVAPVGIIGGISGTTPNDTITKNNNTTSNLSIADLNYYNYALNQSEIIKLYNKKYKAKQYTPATLNNSQNIINVSDRLTTNFSDPKPI